MDALINVNGENVQTLQILFLTTLLTLLPSAVVMMTSFTRYIISFSFLRSAMGLQQNPPNMVLVGIALFLTLFTMSPVISEIQTTAYEPYIAEEITQEEFLQRAGETPEGVYGRPGGGELAQALLRSGRTGYAVCGHRPRSCRCGFWFRPL